MQAPVFYMQKPNDYGPVSLLRLITGIAEDGFKKKKKKFALYSMKIYLKKQKIIPPFTYPK